jgi:hypothetical protein
MATAAQLASAERDSRALPYPPSFVDRFIAWLERLPGPTWLAFAGLGLASVAYVGVLIVLLGVDPAGAAGRFTAIALIPVFSLALIRHLNQVARQALDRFRSLLDVDPVELERLRYQLTVLPERPVAILSAAVILFTIGGAFNAPAIFAIEGAPLAASFLIVLHTCIVGAGFCALALQIVRQLIFVERIHRQASRVDLFNVGPLHAFSRLTSQASIGMLVLVAVLVLTTVRQLLAASSSLATAVAISSSAALGIAAVASFVLPLTGLHNRIAAEKERLQTDADARLTSLLGALHEDAAKLDLSRADGLNKLLGSAFQEREVLAKLPTWPWQAATLRGFVSALILPVLVYVLARAAERVVL